MSIRNLRGTSTPYDVPVALALLKVPLGAFTAILGLVAIQGDFVPGLSALDSQQQILAYALVLGYAQQVFTYSLDRRAQTLLNGLPGQGRVDGTRRRRHRRGRARHRVLPMGPSGPDPAVVPPQFVHAACGNGANNGSAVRAATRRRRRRIDLEPAEPQFEPPPPDDEDVVQDDGSTTLPNVPIGDHR